MRWRLAGTLTIGDVERQRTLEAVQVGLGDLGGAVVVVGRGDALRGDQPLHAREDAHHIGFSEPPHAPTIGANGQRDIAPKQIVLADGTAWIKTHAVLHFPAAQDVLDWAHVERALHRAIRAACSGRAQRERCGELHRTLPDLLWHGDQQATLGALRELRPAIPDAEPVRRMEDTIAYMEDHRDWLDDYAA